MPFAAGGDPAADTDEAAASTNGTGPERAGAVDAVGVAPGTMDLLRFASVGSVDDGKSTLIGRLLFDTRQLFDDQVAAVAAASAKRGIGEVDLSFVTDGLRAEREQGITIDVAYRYAATPHRKFVIADCPGHVQYTRNMATGASTADLALVVVDASTGLREQTRRHACIAALLGVDQFVVCANKMDLVGWDEAAYRAVADEISTLARRLGVASCTVVPASALHGDNVVERSDAAPWYDGPTVLAALEHAPAGGWAAAHGSRNGAGGRLPVQWVLRHKGGGRSYAGMVNGAPLHPGDRVVVLPENHPTTVTAVETYDGPLDEAAVGRSVSVRLADDLDVSRGDMIAAADDPPEVVTELEATVCWFGDRPLRAGDRLRVKHTTRTTPSRITGVDGRLDVNDLKLQPAVELADNDIGVITLNTATALAVDPYRRDRITGSFVLVDEATNATVAAGMVGRPDLMGPDLVEPDPAGQPPA
ncbi:MAG TPA: GTP-binding protein [Acidimicrobiales bacterium]|nr:GTP-binding protein [Acidimicrobiales bacterium]